MPDPKNIETRDTSVDDSTSHGGQGAGRSATCMRPFAAAALRVGAEAGLPLIAAPPPGLAVWELPLLARGYSYI
jgi:hypothetical protein